MALPGLIRNFYVSQGDGKVFLQWDMLAGATTYSVQRSLDNINFTTVAQVAPSLYLDTAVTVGIAYYYKVAGSNSPASYASASLTFASTQPLAADTFSVANVVFVAVASGATGNQFNIGTSIAGTINNLVSAVNASASLLNIVTASQVGLAVSLTSFVIGVEGNGLQFSNALTGVTGAGFTGGSAGGVGIFTTSQSVIPTMGGEMSLAELGIRCRQRADRLNSNFISLVELNGYIQQSMYELYDLLITVYEDYFKAPNAIFYSVGGNTQVYKLPDGITSFFQNDGSTSFVPPPIYKLLGLDLGLNVSNNGWVTVDRYNFNDRNMYFYPNSASTIYGVFNCRYRWMGTNLELIPTPTAQQPFRIQYIPRLAVMLQPTDLTSSSISGWLEYVITDVAIKVLQKEESDVSVLGAQKMLLKTRIEESASYRDSGKVDTICDTRRDGTGRHGGYGGGFHGGY